MAQLKDSVITGSLRVTDTTYTHDLVVNASKTARYALIAPTSDGAPTWRALTNADVGLGNVENTKLSTWAGTNKITTLGTIGTGTWNATIIGTAYGGTGVNSSSTAINKVFASPGSGNAGAPSFRSLVAADIPNLNASKITDGTLAVARGGTNKSSWTKGGIIYASDTTTLGQIADGSADKVLRATASATYSWLSYTSANTASTIVYRDASGNFNGGTISATTLKATGTTDTSSASTGVLQVSGGAGIAKQLYVGSTTILNNGTIHARKNRYAIDILGYPFYNHASAANTSIGCDLYYDAGNANKYSSPRFYFRQYSYTADTTTPLSVYENFRLPATAAGLTANATYDILTSKNLSFSITGSAATATSLLHRTAITKGTNPSATTYCLGSFALETGTGTATKNRLMGFEGNVNTSGRSTMTLIAYQYAASSTTSNAFSVYINADGTRGYSVSDKAAFRSAIGAGTSSLTIGTTATTAAAGNHTHTISEVSWPGGQNLACTMSANGQEFSIDINGNQTGGYWHVWSGKNSRSILRCYNDNCATVLPSGDLYVGEYTKNTATSRAYTIEVQGGAGTLNLYSNSAVNGPRVCSSVNANGDAVHVFYIEPGNRTTFYGKIPRAVAARVGGTSTTVDLSWWCQPGTTGCYAFLVYAGSWVASTTQGSLYLISGLQVGGSNGGIIQICKATHGPSMSFNNTNGKLTITFWNGDGGWYSVMPIYNAEPS